MLIKNKSYQCEIIDISNDSNGIAKIDGIAVFIPSTAVGDIVTVKIVKVLKNYCFGIVEEIITPSQNRIAVDCPVFHKCGSCSFRHINYQKELEIKNSWIKQNLKKFAQIDLELPPIVASPQENRYRNKGVFPVGIENNQVVIGFFARRSHRIIPISDCLLHPESFGVICTAFKEFLEKHKVSVYNEETHTGLVRSIAIRNAEATDKIMVTIITNGKELPFEQELVTTLTKAESRISSIIINTNTQKTNVLFGEKCRTIFGDDTITDKLCDLDYSLSPLSFYQINRQGAQLLYKAAEDFAQLTGNETLIDLYCGAGSIGLSMAGKVKELIGVEVVAPAVENARKNAAQNNITNARFICADAKEAAKQLLEENITPDIVVLDPPRKGCDLEVIETVAAMNPKKVVMISCDSATCARDIKRFEEQGYKLEKIQGHDMFARTGHVEVIIMMTRA